MTRMTSVPQQTIWTPAGELPLTPVAPEERVMVDPGVDRPVGKAMASDEEYAAQLPKPSGYKILCAVPEVERKFGSGLEKADITIQNEELLTTVLFVIAMGPDCYADKTRFPSGPWCQVGDFILVRPMVGSRVKIHGKSFRLINDDCVDGTVLDPRGYARG